MPSPFVRHLLKPLDLSRPPSPTIQHSDKPNLPTETSVKQSLRALLVSLNQPLDWSLVNDTVGSLTQIEQSHSTISGVPGDLEEDALRQAIVSRLVVGLYAHGLDLCISHATDAETEAEWWADTMRSRRNVAWYLLQSMRHFASPLGIILLTGPPLSHFQHFLPVS